MTVRDLLKLICSQKEIDLESEVMVDLDDEDGGSQLIKIVSGKGSVAGSMFLLSGILDMEIKA